MNPLDLLSATDRPGLSDDTRHRRGDRRHLSTSPRRPTDAVLPPSSGLSPGSRGHSPDGLRHVHRRSQLAAPRRAAGSWQTRRLDEGWLGQLAGGWAAAWQAAVRTRRLLAALLAATALVLILCNAAGVLRDAAAVHRVDVVVAAHDMAPGHALVAGDLQRVARPPETVPRGAIREPEAVVGATLAAAVSTEEILTELRVVSPRLAGVATGADDARIVALHPADSAVAEILRPGDHVDIVTADESADAARSPTARVLASNAVVVLVAGADTGRSRGDRIALLALDGPHAVSVAAAALRTPMTVVVR